MSLKLTEAELVEITGYKIPTMQLNVLHAMGFKHARIASSGLYLARSHFLQVTAGIKPAMKAPEVPTGWLGTATHARHLERLRTREARAAEMEAEAILKRKNAEEAFAAAKEHQAQVSVRNRKELVRFHSSLRRSAQMQRTPAWADRRAIRAVYAEALRLKRETGIEHHVDHIIPLQGALVSGLHVENNLQVLPWLENIQKRNHFEVDA